MKELYEFRIFAKYASEVCSAKTPAAPVIAPGGVVGGIVGDDQYRRVEEVDRRLRQVGESAFAGWQIRREYTPAEIDRAELLLLRMPYVHMAGDEHGTEYTDAPADPACGLGRKQPRTVLDPLRFILVATPDLRCGLGSRQIGPLNIPLKQLPKARDLLVLWSGEFIVSDRLAEAMKGGTGASLLTIRNAAGRQRSVASLRSVPSGAELLARAKELGLVVSADEFWSWCKEDGQLPLFENFLWERLKESASGGHTQAFHQLEVHSKPMTVADQTVFGDSPFRGASECCKCGSGFGEVRGLNLLSELYVEKSGWDGSDICATNVFVGGRTGLFRPHRLLAISQRLFRAMQKQRVRGVEFEVVQLV
jgi:hypothetical protein